MFTKQKLFSKRLINIFIKTFHGIGSNANILNLKYSYVYKILVLIQIIYDFLLK